MKTSRYQVPALERALSIMEWMATRPAGSGISEMAEALELPKNSVFRILNTLHASGYIQRDESSKTYRLGRKLLSLGYAAVGETNLVEKALDVMRVLRDLTKETTLFGTLLGDEGIVLEQVPSPLPIKFLVEVGARYPLHTAAPGKAMLAFLPESERSAIVNRIEYPRFTARTITSAKDFSAELDDVRISGYAIDHAEQIEGLHCIAAPIFNQHGYPCASIWITGPSVRLPRQNFSKLGEVVIEKAQIISARLGYNLLSEEPNGRSPSGARTERSAGILPAR